MKETFQKLLWGAPVLAVVLYFALQGKDEMKAEQAEAKAERRVDEARFDRDFDKAWQNAGKLPGGKDADARLADAEKDLAEAKARRQVTDQVAAEDLRDLKAALQDNAKK
jgi:hypothetical protein